MKKQFLRIATLLFTVAVLTVNASAAEDNSNCNNNNNLQNTLLQYVLSGRNADWDCNELLKELCGDNFWFTNWFGNQNCEETNPCENNNCEADPCLDGSCNEDPCLNGNCEEGLCEDGNCDNGTLPPVVTPPVVEPPVTEEPEPEPEPETPSITDPSISAYEAEVISLVNDIRQSYGLGSLTANAQLCEVARIKSQDMRDNNYFSHTSPIYGSPFDMMKTFGISYRTAGENIAYGYSTPQSVVDGWMNSEGHRANILNSSYTEIGVGYVSSGNYWTQMFIG